MKNKKQRVSRQESFNLFAGKTFIQLINVYIVSNIKPYQTQLILNCVLLFTMRVNHQKILTFQKLSDSLGLLELKNFHRFVILGGRIEPIVCLVFYLIIKMWENLYKKPYQK